MKLILITLLFLICFDKTVYSVKIIWFNENMDFNRMEPDVQQGRLISAPEKTCPFHYNVDSKGRCRRRIV